MLSDALCQLGMVSVRLNASQTENTYQDQPLSDLVMDRHLAPCHAWPGLSLAIGGGQRVALAPPARRGLKAMRRVMPTGRLPGCTLRRAIADFRAHPARQYLSVLRAQPHP